MMPNIECWLGSFMIVQGHRINIPKKPYIFGTFQGGGVEPPAPHLEPRMKEHVYAYVIND